MIELHREILWEKKPHILIVVLIILLLGFYPIKNTIAQEEALPIFIISVGQPNHNVEIVPNNNTIHKINGNITLSYQWKDNDPDFIVDIDINKDSSWKTSTQPSLIFKKGDIVKNFTFEVSIPGNLRHSFSKMVGYTHYIEFFGFWKTADSNLSGEIPINPYATYYFYVNHYFDLNIDKNYCEISLNTNDQIKIEFTLWNTGNGYDLFYIDTRDLEEKIDGMDIEVYQENGNVPHDEFSFEYNQSLIMNVVFNFTNQSTDTQELLGFINISSLCSLDELGIPVYKHIDVKVKVEYPSDKNNTESGKNNLNTVFWITTVIITILLMIILVILIKEEKINSGKNGKSK